MLKLIIQQPKILIVDEIFIGLDMLSLFQAQQLLKKHLPHTIIIIVDHYAENNNYDGLYDCCIEFDPEGRFKIIGLNIVPFHFKEHETCQDYSAEVYNSEIMGNTELILC